MKESGGLILVTGGSGGIGSGVVDRLIQGGYRVIACDRVAPSQGDGSLVPALTSVQVDVSQPEAAATLLDAVRSSGRPLMGLVNAHGMQFREDIGEFPDKMFDLVLRVNLVATFRLIRDLLPLMESGARVVNFSSLYAVLPAQAQVAYAAAKAGVEGLTRAAAMDLAPRGITVNAIAPGLVWHDGLEGIWPDQVFEQLRKRIPVGRAGEVSEVAELVAYLLSPASGYLTGQIIRLDGGSSAGTVAGGS